MTSISQESKPSVCNLCQCSLDGAGALPGYAPQSGTPIWRKFLKFTREFVSGRGNANRGDPGEIVRHVDFVVQDFNKDHLDLCAECGIHVKSVLEESQQVDDIEGRVRQLQQELLGELGKLQSSLILLCHHLEGIAGRTNSGVGQTNLEQDILNVLNSLKVFSAQNREKCQIQERPLQVEWLLVKRETCDDELDASGGFDGVTAEVGTSDEDRRGVTLDDSFATNASALGERSVSIPEDDCRSGPVHSLRKSDPSKLKRRGKRKGNVETGSVPAPTLEHGPSSADPWKCSVCQKRCPDKKSLSFHLQTHLEEEERDRILCSLCGQSMYRKSYRKHVTHGCPLRTVDRVVCETCGKDFKGSYNLKLHMEKIHCETPQTSSFSCDLCGKGGFKRRELLWNHVRLHTNKRDFVCGRCAADFKCRKDLRRHEQKCDGTKKPRKPRYSTMLKSVD